MQLKLFISFHIQTLGLYELCFMKYVLGPNFTDEHLQIHLCGWKILLAVCHYISSLGTWPLKNA